MKRKNTIIIAVFVNAALLIALFVTGVNKKEIQPIAAVEALKIEPTAVKKEEIKETKGDEIDQILKEFAAKKPEITEEKKTPKIDFAKELEMITKNASENMKKPEKNTFEITVQKGDSLQKIANANGTTVESLIKLNGLKNTVLQIGQVLKVSKTAASKNVPPVSEYYVVKAGDNPWSIAAKNQMKVDELLRLNNLNNEKARHLKPGDKLRIK